MKGFPFIAVILLGVLVSLAIVALPDSGQTATQSEEARAGNEFKLAERTGGEVQGSLEYPGKLVTKFRGSVADEGEDRSSMVRLEAGGLTIDTKRNLRTRMVTMDGHDETITVDERKSLLALCRELESSFGALGTSMQPQEDLLVRSTCYYAEAPVGYKLAKVTHTSNGSEQALAMTNNSSLSNVSYELGATSDSLNAPTPEECDQTEQLRNNNVLKNFTVFIACQRGGQDGIRYLECRARGYELWHDSEFHCYRSGQYPTGPCEKNCRGRCGTGCGGDGGKGTYSRDCAEHDRCAGHDGTRSWGVWGADRSCGDEWDEARDDFLDGRDNCSGRC